MPDDGHVTLRPEGGGEITVALDDIHEATLVVDFGRRRKPGEAADRRIAIAIVQEE